MRWALIAVILGVLGGSGVVWADEGPISGTIKSVDARANTITLEATARGKTRQVTVYLKPGAKVVRFSRATEPGKTGFVEQAMALTDIKPGWIVSVERGAGFTQHGGFSFPVTTGGYTISSAAYRRYQETPWPEQTGDTIVVSRAPETVDQIRGDRGKQFLGTAGMEPVLFDEEEDGGTPRRRRRRKDQPGA